ncbi:S8 family serine peptidase [Pontibacter indicus]|uniref:Por secretion system C-terminal sorting domain-containing protein n=1 Tax=Pontibacter indicus TaxID=1317125 RepID=A0A1R3XQL6_9BACT|nr:S8 family serine peptidase [Pontibacter indicus]SIT94190.1 Por secretion system C-terminal sorting domain-containing protein [Pontibacter indicus]
MPPRYKLKQTHWLPVLFLLALLPLQSQAQQAPSTLPKQTVRKLAPHLQRLSQTAPAASYRIQVSNKKAFYTWLQQHQPAVTIKDSGSQGNMLLISGIKPAQLLQLAASSEVLYVDKPNRRAVEELELKDTDFVVNNVYAAQAAFPEMAGQGMAVSVKEAAFDPDDIDLQGRVLNPETIQGNRSSHATTMATLLAGAGNSGPSGKGVTQHALLAHSSFEELFPDNSADLLSQGISVQNHSYGVGVENYYGLEAQAYDEQSFQHPALLHVFSSGNSGDKAESSGTYADLPGIANLTGQFKTSKNTLSVGALDPDGQVGIRSSRGPAYDGRIKPELVAHGAAGTSESAAVVSGIALLVQQLYKAQHGSLPPASLVKAALINSAEDAGSPGPDFASGFGNADALGALRSIESQRFKLDAVTAGQTRTFQLNVPKGVRRLKATLVWHDPAAAPDVETALVNDLDLVLRHPASGKSWLPWVLSTFPHPDSLQKPARRRPDRLNNVEQITIGAPAAGTYTLQVSGFRVPEGAQEFSLVYELEQGLEWLYPMATTTLTAGQANRIAWQPNAATGVAELQYRLQDSDNWHTVASGIDLRQGSYTWQAPDTVAQAQLRLFGTGIALQTEEFILARPATIQIGFSCEEQLMVHWSKQPNAQEYQLLQLGATHLEPLTITSDTLAIIDRSALQGRYLAVAPLIQGAQVTYSRSIPTDAETSPCYISSFQPHQLVTPDVARFNLNLSTTYQLAHLRLERLEKGSFKPIDNGSPTAGLQYQFLDPKPIPGRNVYRASAITANGKTIYSQEEAVIYTPQNFVQVYPNPVAVGQPLFVAVENETVSVQIIDRLGRPLRESHETGMLKELQTSGLLPGLYIIRLTNEKGTVLSSKVVVQ